jgi:hypothetical protein
MRALLDFGSETPDNLDMAERISGERGLRLRSKTSTNGLLASPFADCTPD